MDIAGVFVVSKPNETRVSQVVIRSPLHKLKLREPKPRLVSLYLLEENVNSAG